MGKCPFPRAIFSRNHGDPANLNSSMTYGSEIFCNYFYIGLHSFYFFFKTGLVAHHGSGLCLSAYKPDQ